MHLARFILSFLFLCPFFANASENRIYLHNGKLKAHFSPEWAIIGHKPTGNKTVIAFQIFENKAEQGTKESTNLAVTTFYLKDTESMLAFTQPLTEEAKEGEKDSEYNNWIIRDWGGKQGDVKYHISDARITHGRLGIGIHVRLAWPLLAKNSKNYDEQMKKLLYKLLDDLIKENPKKENKSP